MKKKKNKLLRGILIAVCAALLLTAAVKIVLINLKYPEPTDVPVQKNETVTFRDVDLTYTDSQVASLEDTCKQYGVKIPMDFYMWNNDIEKICVYCMNVTFENKTSETQSIDAWYFNVMQSDFSMTLDDRLYSAINGTDQISITLKPGEKTERILTFTLYDYRFSKERWANIKNLDYTVLFNVYPEKMYFVAQ